MDCSAPAWASHGWGPAKLRLSARTPSRSAISTKGHNDAARCLTHSYGMVRGSGTTVHAGSRRVPRRFQGKLRAGYSLGSDLSQPGVASASVPIEQLRLQSDGTVDHRRHQGHETAAFGWQSPPASRASSKRTNANGC